MSNKYKQPNISTQIIQDVLTITQTPNVDYRLWYPYTTTEVNNNKHLSTTTDFPIESQQHLHFSTIFQIVINKAFTAASVNTLQDSTILSPNQKKILETDIKYKKAIDIILKLKHYEWASKQCRKVFKSLSALFQHRYTSYADLKSNCKVVINNLMMKPGNNNNDNNNNTKTPQFQPDLNSFSIDLPDNNSNVAKDIQLAPISRPVIPIGMAAVDNESKKIVSQSQKQIFSNYHDTLYFDNEIHDNIWFEDVIDCVRNISDEYESYLYNLMMNVAPHFPWYDHVDLSSQNHQNQQQLLPSSTDLIILNFFEYINRNIINNEFIITTTTTKTKTNEKKKDNNNNNTTTNTQYITPLMNAACCLDIYQVEALVLCGALFYHELIIFSNNKNNNNNNTLLSHPTILYTINDNTNDLELYYKYSQHELLQPFISIEMDMENILNLDPKDFFTSTHMTFKLLLLYGLNSNILYDIKQEYLHPLFKNLLNNSGNGSSNLLLKKEEEENKKEKEKENNNTTTTLSLQLLFIHTLMLYLDAWELSIVNIELLPLDFWQLLLSLDSLIVNKCACCDFHNPLMINNDNNNNKTKNIVPSPSSPRYIKNTGHITLIEIMLSYPYIDITIMFDVILLALSSLYILPDIHIHHNIDLVGLFIQQQIIKAKEITGEGDYSSFLTLEQEKKTEHIQNILQNTKSIDIYHFFIQQQESYIKHITEKNNNNNKNNEINSSTTTTTTTTTTATQNVHTPSPSYNYVTNEHYNIPTDDKKANMTQYLQNNKIGQVVSLYISFNLLRQQQQQQSQQSQSTNTNEDENKTNIYIEEPSCENGDINVDNDNNNKKKDKNIDEFIDVDTSLLKSRQDYEDELATENAVKQMLDEMEDRAKQRAAGVDLPAKIWDVPEVVLKNQQDLKKGKKNKEEKGQIEDQQKSSSSYAQHFNEDIKKGFDYSNFLQYIALHDVMVSYEQYNKVIGNCEVETNNKQDDKDNNNNNNKKNNNIPTTDNLMKDDTLLVNNVIKSMFQQHVPSLTQYKIATRNELQKEVDMLTKVRAQHEMLVEQRRMDRYNALVHIAKKRGITVEELIKEQEQKDNKNNNNNNNNDNEDNNDDNDEEYLRTLDERTKEALEEYRLNQIHANGNLEDNIPEEWRNMKPIDVMHKFEIEYD